MDLIHKYQQQKSDKSTRKNDMVSVSLLDMLIYTMNKCIEKQAKLKNIEEKNIQAELNRIKQNYNRGSTKNNRSLSFDKNYDMHSILMRIMKKKMKKDFWKWSVIRDIIKDTR